MNSTPSNGPIKTNYPALYTLVTVFFFWGFFAAGNSIFIPFCKNYFDLDQFQSQLIDFSFYTAYYFGSLALFVLSTFRGKDQILSWGYKKSIVYGLLFSTLGACLMIWAVQVGVYTGLLVGLFVVALGFSLQQTAANPFVILLGNPKTGASRVNLAGGVNSFGTTIGPLIVAFALFGTTASLTDDQIQHLSLDKMSWLYGGVGILFVVAAALFYFSKKIPDTTFAEPMEKANKALVLLVVMTVLLLVAFIPVFNTYKSVENNELLLLEKQLEQRKEQLALEDLVPAEWQRRQAEVQGIEKQVDQLKQPLEHQRILWLGMGLVVILGALAWAYRGSKKDARGWGAMQYPQLVLGMVAIFAYIGAEVGIGSNLGELLKLESFGGLHSSEIAPYISMYWGSLMIGRWAGAVSVFHIRGWKKSAALIVVPLLAFFVILGVNTWAGNDVTPLYYYIVCVLVQIFFSFWSQDKAAKTLLLFSIFGVTAMAVGLMTEGMVAIYAFLAGGLACSIMWPAIFNLAIIGLGKYTAQGSSFLIMMILGGGIIPPIQGKLADIVGIHQSYWISLGCFVYLLIFAVTVKKVLLKQNIDIDFIEK